MAEYLVPGLAYDGGEVPPGQGGGEGAVAGQRLAREVVRNAEVTDLCQSGSRTGSGGDRFGSVRGGSGGADQLSSRPTQHSQGSTSASPQYTAVTTSGGGAHIIS